MNDTPTTHKVSLEITWKSVMRILLGVLLAYLAVLLWPILKMLILAILVAVALYPLVTWVGRKGWPRWVGVLVASATLLAVVVGCLAIIAPVALSQAASLSENLPKLREQIIARLPASGPVRPSLGERDECRNCRRFRLVLERATLLPETTAGSLFRFMVVIVLAIYLLADGPRALNWLIVFFPARERQKISQASGQIADLIFAYVAGQFLVSAFCAAYLFLVLMSWECPWRLLLGVIAGICDVVPIMGFCVAVGLAMMLGLTVSPDDCPAGFCSLWRLPLVRELRCGPEGLWQEVEALEAGSAAGGCGWRFGGWRGWGHCRAASRSGLPCRRTTLAGTQAGPRHREGS